MRLSCSFTRLAWLTAVVVESMFLFLHVLSVAGVACRKELEYAGMQQVGVYVTQCQLVCAYVLLSDFLCKRRTCP